MAVVVINLGKKRKVGKCPGCGKLGQEKYQPFCSQRCADLDLAKWFNGSYSVPVVELNESDLDELDTVLENGDGSRDEGF